jgi:hypothetical protein
LKRSLPADTEALTDMRIGWKTLALLLVAALVAVPAAGAKPGNGHGGGKPSWAGTGGHGKPEWAGKGHEKAEKAKAEKGKAAKAEEAGGLKGKLKGLELDELTPEDLEDLNPAWTCKVERLLMEVESFADEYGTNDNKANSFGKCVSEEAHARDGVSAEAVEAFCEPSEEETAGEAAGGETTEEQTTEEQTTQEETTEGEDEVVVVEDATDESEEPELCAGDTGVSEEGSADESEGVEGETSESDDPVLAALRSLF